MSRIVDGPSGKLKHSTAQDQPDESEDRRTRAHDGAAHGRALFSRLRFAKRDDSDHDAHQRKGNIQPVQAAKARKESDNHSRQGKNSPNQTQHRHSQPPLMMEPRDSIASSSLRANAEYSANPPRLARCAS